MASIAAIPEVDVAPEPKRWTTEQFVRLDENGELGDDDEHFELLDGEIYKKLGQNGRHVVTILLATEALRLAFGPGFTVSQQLPVRLSEADRPEPDLAVLRGTARDFDGRELRAEDVVMLVEVADSRLDLAKGKKLTTYARRGVCEYWIIDVKRRVVEVRRIPMSNEDGWAETRLYPESDAISPMHAPDTKFAVKDLLPAKRD